MPEQSNEVDIATCLFITFLYTLILLAHPALTTQQTL